jgi:DNA polymerase, archaea type
MAIMTIVKRCPNNLQIKINSNHRLVHNSASYDSEWTPYEGRYEHNKTEIFEACFCTNLGERIALHISNYPSEKELIEDILFYFNQFPLTFGWYSTGVSIYDHKDNNLKLSGHDSDFYILHQRCLLYELNSPFEITYAYSKLRGENSNRQHIDMNRVFNKDIIKDNVFGGRYRTSGLDNVSRALLGIGKYGDLNASRKDFRSLPAKEQIRYVQRDTELTILLAQYNDCLTLRLMEVFSKYAQMDYYKVCHTNVTHWYANRYWKMIKSKECTLEYTPDYKLPKLQIAGGHHTTPVRGFFVGIKIYEKDVKGEYPSIVKNNNLSFDTKECTCCEFNEDAQTIQETIDTINEGLEKCESYRRVKKSWVCKKRTGAFPIVIEELLEDRNKYQTLLKQEKSKPSPSSQLIEEYEAYQLGTKLLANAGYGVFAHEKFAFSNYKVAEHITGEGRRIHKQMESIGQADPFNFKIVYGFTDSTFFIDVPSDEKAQEFILHCKEKLGVTVELKNIFLNSICYGKKNKFVGWSGKKEDKLVIKGLNGLSESDPLWVKDCFNKVLNQIVRHPETRFEIIPIMLKEAFNELESFTSTNNTTNNKDIEKLRYTNRVGQDLHEYVNKKNGRTYNLARQLGKEKGDLVYYYKIYTEQYIKSKNYFKKVQTYSTTVNNDLDYEDYKNYLLEKLKDTLEITGFDFCDLKLRLKSNDAKISYLMQKEGKGKEVIKQ